MNPIECPCGRTAEALMRSRYTAYVLKNVDYLVETTLPASREPGLADDIRNWMNQVTWQRLHVLGTTAGDLSVTFQTLEISIFSQRRKAAQQSQTL
ncbi:MAG: YchJ family metal-binding protein [Kiritimatiellales bacterium]